jgi:cytoskeletal protein RodZ
MSLINDALKRAKQNQEANPPATPPLEFRPVESGQNEGRRTSLLLVGLSLVIVAIVGMCGALVWYVSQKNGPTLQVEASSNQRQPSPVTNAPAQPAPKSKPPVMVVEPAVAPSVATEIPQPAVVTNEPVVAAVVTAIEALKPAPLKLQGIFFNPKNPSAVVNGKTVYLGERIGGFFVLAMSPTSVTFANNATTNVLSLSE